MNVSRFLASNRNLVLQKKQLSFSGASALRASFTAHRTWEGLRSCRLHLKMQQDIRILKRKGNAVMIALCPRQIW